MEDKAQLLKDEIRKDARKKADRVLKKAEKEAADILADAAAEVSRLREQAAKETSLLAAGRANKIAAGTGLEIKKRRLQRVDAFCRELAEEALNRLTALSGDKALSLCLLQIRRSLQEVDDPAAVVTVSDRVDCGAVEKALAGSGFSGTVTVDSQLSAAECIVSSADGSRRCEAVFRRMYAMDELKYLRAVYRGVFGGGDV